MFVCIGFILWLSTGDYGREKFNLRKVELKGEREENAALRRKKCCLVFIRSSK